MVSGASLHGAWPDTHSSGDPAGSHSPWANILAPSLPFSVPLGLGGQAQEPLSTIPCFHQPGLEHRAALRALGPGLASLLGGGGEVPTLLAASTPLPSLVLSLQTQPVPRVGLAYQGLSPPPPLQWSCCGARGPNDWNLNIYFNCTDLNPSRERCGVPFSCCVRDPAVSGAWGGAEGIAGCRPSRGKPITGLPGPSLGAVDVRRKSLYVPAWGACV